MKKYLTNILYGFLAWLIPFVASFFFTQIGIMYLAIPAMSIAVGTALENKK